MFRTSSRISTNFLRLNSLRSAIVAPDLVGETNVDHVDNDINNVPATSIANLIRIVSVQITQGLYDAADSMNHEMLQELSAEIVKYSKDAIERKVSNKKLPTENVVQEPQQQPADSNDHSLQKAINERMANVVENSREVEPMSSKRRKNGTTKNLFDLFTKLPNDDGQYDIYLNICDPDLVTNHQQLRRDYIASKRSDTNVPFLLFSFLCGAFFVGTGFAWSNDMNTYRNYPTAALSILFAFLFSISILWVILNRVALLSFRYNFVGLQWYHKYVTKLYDSSYGQWPDNLACLCAALSTSFYLVNIVLMDLCDPDMDVNVGMYNPRTCNSSVEPLPETYLLTMLIVLLIQIAARGVSRIALVCSWMICFVAINASIYLSVSGSYVWMNLLQLLIVWVSYELERQPLRQFIKTIRAVEAAEMAAKLKVRLAAYEAMKTAEALKAKCSLVRIHNRVIFFPRNIPSSIIINIVPPTFQFPSSGASHCTRDSDTFERRGSRCGHVAKRTRTIRGIATGRNYGDCCRY